LTPVSQLPGADEMPARLIVLCPDGLVTGGVEALHQLVDSARRQDIPASICYFPPGRREVVDAYKHYDVEVSVHVPDASDVLVVAPETSTKVLTFLTRTRKALWWLSIDNFFLHLERPVSEAGSDPEQLQALFRPDSQIVHVTQSEYARRFLSMRSVPSTMLTDYLSDAFVTRAEALQKQPKKDLVLYNPRKGLDFTRQLIEASRGQLEWAPIEGLDADGVAELLGSAKLYVDFGQHPGRDRIPREAGLSGCCILTGRRGAAANDIDLPIPARFRLDDSAPDVVCTAVDLAVDTIMRFDEVTEEFAPYRNWIVEQRSRFDDETALLWKMAWAPRFRGASVGNGKHAKGKQARKRKR
jgi:hypothetical protein